MRSEKLGNGGVPLGRAIQHLTTRAKSRALNSLPDKAQDVGLRTLRFIWLLPWWGGTTEQKHV
jgi:hypothetical protein